MWSTTFHRLRLALAAGCLGAALFTAGANAATGAPPSGETYLPPAGTVFQGVATKPVSAYTSTVHKHPAIYQEFVAWGQWLPGITADATDNRARMMIEITTAYGSTNRITPRGIADGSGDAWLIGLLVDRRLQQRHLRPTHGGDEQLQQPLRGRQLRRQLSRKRLLGLRVQAGLAPRDTDLPRR